MLTKEAFDHLSLMLGWSDEACALAKKIRNSEPVRLVRGGRGNVRGRYPSRKMGCVIQFESHTCELPWIMDMEYHQEDVLEYWDQPTTFKINYRNKNGRGVSPMHTPDFFVIRKTHAEFVECKTEEELASLANSQPNKYYLGKDGQWRFPPGEEVAAQFGFRYRVVSTAEIDRTQVRNTTFLEDYLGEDTPPVTDKKRGIITSIVAGEPGVLLLDLLERSSEASVTADDVYTLIANGTIFVDLRSEALAEPDRVWVYPDSESAQKNTRATSHVLSPKGKYVEVKEGERLLLNNSVFVISVVGDSKIFLEGEKGAAPCLTFSRFEDLVKRGEIQAISSGPDSDPDSRWRETWNNTKEKRKREALRRRDILLCHLDKRPLPQPVPARTLARWKSRYKAAERAYGNGLVGLLPGWHRRGDRKSERLHPDARQLMQDVIETEYETIVRKHTPLAYGILVERCKQKKVKYPSLVTFIAYIKKRPQYIQAKKRLGHRAAYVLKPFYLRLERDTPPHGDRPFEICHIDHTELDIELVDPNDGENFGRPWATFMVDAYSRRILAVYLTYDPPSKCSDMMVVRECVRRHARLPQTIVVDGGGDFHSIYFEKTLAAAFEIIVKTRPPAEPRFGSVIERLFNTAHAQFVHNLLGNTQITRNVRQVTKENDPEKLAVWSLGPFYESLCDWAYNRYDAQRHWTLKQSPREVYLSTLRLTGLRQHRLVTYDENFKILTMPPTKKETAKYIAGRGLKITNEYYRSIEVDEDAVHGQSLPVRYDPFNYAVAYAQVGEQWVKLLANNHHELDGRTEREQKIMTAEKRKRDRLFSRDFADRVAERAVRHRADQEREREQSEQLRKIRKRKLENAIVRQSIDGGPESAVPARTEADGVAGAGRKEGEASPSQSLFSDIDMDKLGSLEAYKR